MRRILSGIALALGVLTATVDVADAGKSKQVRFVGIHPVAKADGGGMCYIEGPHVHIYAADKVQYRDHRGHNHFVGDPVAYGYDGPKHTYKGHHPIHVDAVVGSPEPDVEFCYLDGAHYHYFEPTGPDFKVVGGVNFYVGEPPAAYIEARPAMVAINATYRPLVYERPVVTVEPPSGWIGVRFAAPAVVVETPAVVVRPPRAGVSVDVVVPTPSLHIDVGIGGHIHSHPGRARGHYKHGKFKHKKWKRR